MDTKACNCKCCVAGYRWARSHGYRNNTEKTIEGDLFGAFVAAGAVSKANADDPKKSALVRCARTDKGVHAAGNVISMKLIIEDVDIVQKINSHLSPQVRIWGIERTNGSFSAYQACDSRIYEYLIPTHCFIPPHPQSFLGKKVVELAEGAGDLEGYKSRQQDAMTFWSDVEDEYIKPVLDELDPEIATQALQALFDTGMKETSRLEKDEEQNLGQIESSGDRHQERVQANTLQEPLYGHTDSGTSSNSADLDTVEKDMDSANTDTSTPNKNQTYQASTEAKATLDSAIKALKASHLRAKLAYRISAARLERVKSVLSRYTGTHNFHNYTIHKHFRDPAAKRHVKSFLVSDDPLLVNGTEWLSLKVHGQSFMMHQIRKMVSMAALVVRCGTHEGRIQDSFQDDRLSIPRAPGLGLLLERPVFDSYNKNLRHKGGPERAEVAFDAYREEMEAFKQREIYERIWREEGRGMLFHGLFAAIDSLRSPQLLYLSSEGIQATKRKIEGAVENKGGTGEKSLEEAVGMDDEGVEEAAGGEEG